MMDASSFDKDGVLRGRDVGDIRDWLTPRIVADLSVDGDDDDRREIDRRLNDTRRRQYADQPTWFTF
jgi:hypothetical protein